MLCSCHGEPAYWQKNTRLLAGGFWLCAVTKRERARRVDTNRREVKNQKRRDKYDADPVWRIEHLMKNAAARRAKTLKRLREEHGALQTEGRG